MATAVSAPSGTFPLRLGDDLFAGSSSNGGKSNLEEISAFRYAFKPGSVVDIPGYLTNHASGSKEMTFDVVNGGQQVFDVREEAGKLRECALIYNEETRGYTLRLLPTTFHLTLNRNASSVTRPSTGNSQISSVSTSSSASVPLSAQRKHSAVDDVFEDNTFRASKKPRPSTKADAGEHFPSAASPLAAPKTATLKTAKGKGKGGAKKSTAKRTGKAGNAKGKAVKPPSVPEGKFKSAEIIEDSDEEYELSEVGVEPATAEADNGDEDEFARMIGESLAEPDEQPLPGPLLRRGYEEEDESEESGEESDEEELGGATLIGQTGGALNDGESEWL